MKVKLPYQKGPGGEFEQRDVIPISGKLYFYKEYRYWFGNKWKDRILDHQKDRKLGKLIKEANLFLEKDGQKYLLLKLEIKWKYVHPINLSTSGETVVKLDDYDIRTSRGWKSRRKIYAPGFEFFGQIKKYVLEERKAKPKKWKDEWGIGLVYEF